MKEFKTLSDLTASKQTVSDLMLYCRENNLYYIVQDAGYTPVGDDVTFTNGRVGKAVVIADAKYIKTTSGNVQDELDSIVSGGLPTQTGNQFKFLSTDGTDAQWVNGQIEVATFAALEALEPEEEGLVFICQERENAKYILQDNSYVALAGDVTFSNGRIASLQIGGTVLTGWFGNIADAVARGRDILVTDNYTVSSVLTVDCTNEAFTIDLGGHTLTSDNAGVFSAFGGLLYEQNVSSHTANTITIGAGTDLADYLAGVIEDKPVVKIVSEDATDPSTPTSERVGEYVRVVDIVSGVMTLESDLYFTYTTSPRVAALVSEKLTIKNGTLDVSDLDSVRGTQVFLTKLISPLVEDIEIVKGNDAGVLVRSCYEAQIVRPSIHNLRDDEPNGYFGYGVDDSSSYATLVSDGNFSNTRHAYTTTEGSYSGVGSIDSYGPTMYSKVSRCVCSGNSADAFDTHSNAYFITFENCKTFNNALGAVKDRAKFTTIKGHESVNDDFGFRASTKSDGLKIINCSTRSTDYPLFFNTTTVLNAEVKGCTFDVDDLNECFRITNVNLKGDLSVSYSGTTTSTNIFRVTNSVINLSSVSIDLSNTSVASIRCFGFIDDGNYARVGSLAITSDTVNTTVSLANDFSGGSANKIQLKSVVSDEYHNFASTSFAAGSYHRSSWIDGDSSSFFVTITASDQGLPQLAYNGSTVISMTCTVTGSTKDLIALPDGGNVGQKLLITLSKNSAFGLDVKHGSSFNTDLIGGADKTLSAGESISFFWNGADWEEFLQTN